MATDFLLGPATELELFAHLLNLNDAATRGSITSATRLVALYQFDDPKIDNQLLRNLTGIAKPGTYCQLVTNNKTYPPSLAEGEQGYCLVVTYNKLLTAPAVRLECRFYNDTDRERGVYLTLVLEFHWKACGDIEPSVGYFKFGDDIDPKHERLSFKTRGATSSGFPLVKKYENQLSESAKDVINVLKGFLQPQQPVQVRLLLERPIHPEMAKIRSYLPGGDKFQLPSLYGPEWNMYRSADGRINLQLEHVPGPKRLITAKPPHPMVQLECSDTFTSVDEAVAQLAYSAHSADEEAQQALSLWAKPITPHRATLYHTRHFVIMAVKYGSFKKLGSAMEDGKFRLPDKLRSDMRFIDPVNGQDESCKGDLIDLPANVRPHDAFFVITEGAARKLGASSVPFDNPQPKYFNVSFSPRHDTFMITSQISTADQLRHERNKRWIPILLNQLHDTIPLVDLTSDPNLNADVVAAAYAELESWMEWNAEQLEAIQGLKRTTGGFVCIMGPAGTGKTLLQQALAKFVWQIGYHVLALAPANSNANHLTREMARKCEGVECLRLYSASLNDNLHELRSKEGRDAAHVTGEASGLRDLQFELIKDQMSTQTKKTDAKDYDVQRAVLRAAAEGILENMTRLTPNGPVENCWDAFRACLAEIEAGTFQDLNDEQKGRYSRAYSNCKGHIVSLCRFIITTTGNVRNADLIDYWAKGYHGVKCLGVVVFIDEAAKDVEINAWSGIVCEGWAPKVKGVVMFGDDKQLKPCNTSQKGRLNFNCFNARLDVPLPCRLVSQNFPSIRLRQQRRMHACISAFPNRQFYEGALQNGPGTERKLEDVEPGLTPILHRIIASNYRNPVTRENYEKTATDEQARLAYVEINGFREKHEQTSSVVVKEHIGIFFRRIYPGLLQHFGSRLCENVMVICAYSHAKQRWHRAIADVQDRQGLTKAHLPNLVTLDSSQGSEAFMVVFDGSFQHSDRMGFLVDSGRSNVAMTRAQQVFWILGGKLNVKNDANFWERPPHFALYKTQLEQDGHVHKLGLARGL